MGRKIDLLKSNFASGELDPDAVMRTDIKHYYSGAYHLSDVVVKPMGGVRRRDGLAFVEDLTSVIANDQAVRSVPFEFSVFDTYLLIFLHEQVKVVRNGVVVHTITGTPWTRDQLRSINWTQSYDTLIVLHRDVQPQRIVRITDTNWTVAPMSFTNMPRYDYLPVTTSPAGSIAVSNESGKITITGTGTSFNAGYVGQKIEGNGGRARIVRFNSATSLTAVVEIPFFNTQTITTTNWQYLSGFEDAWGGARGWPVTGCFHGGRLMLGGGPRPSTLWGSRIGDILDFEMLTGLDDEPIEVTLDNDGLNQIVNIMSLRDLLIFTTGGEFVQTASPITPNNIAPVQQTQRGSEPGTRVMELEGAALFVQRKGKAIREFYYTDSEGSYVAENLTLLASHLIEQPTDFVKRRASSTSESDLLVVINSNGSARMCSTIRSQEVVAWSRITNGHFVACGIDDDVIYFVVRREVDGSQRYFLERFDPERLTDCSVRVEPVSPSNEVIADHLPSMEVTAFSDGADMGEIQLDADGEGIIGRNAQDYYELGLNFVPRIETMPIEQDMEGGTSIGRKKRIVEATLELRDTTYIEVNNNRVSFRKFGPDLLDKPPIKFTGRVTEEGLLGYYDKAQLTITQQRPGYMDILGVAVKVSF